MLDDTDRDAIGATTIGAQTQVDHGDQRRVEIFLSSPSDVNYERLAAERVVDRLATTHSISLRLKRWEKGYYEATKGFQELIGGIDSFDLVVGIFWSRIGSRLPIEKFQREDGRAYESGTVFEIESAMNANRQSNKPSVHVFRKTEKPLITLDDPDLNEKKYQKEALEDWWERTFCDTGGHNVGGFNDFSSVQEFETKFENFLENWLRKRGDISDKPVWDRSPYPGLNAYNDEFRSVFFGRTHAINYARDALREASERDGAIQALFVIGASGSGKSSLVRAGLLPKLEQAGAIPGVDVWRRVVMEPTADSLATLAERLYEALPELKTGAQPTAFKWAHVASESPEAAADTLGWALDRVSEAERQRAGRDLKAALMLGVDQLEILFGTDGQIPFSRALRALVTSERTRGRVWLIATMRNDRDADLQGDPDLLALKRDGATYDLPQLSRNEISDIVKGPARAAGLVFEDRDGRSLARELVEVTPNADALPLLQMTLAQLYERSDDKTLAFAAYGAIGGVEGVIAKHADEVFATASAAARRELRPLLRALVCNVRRQSHGQPSFNAGRTDLKSFETSAARKELVKILVDGRLLVSDNKTIRVAHEVLLRRWDPAKKSIQRIAFTEQCKVILGRLFPFAARPLRHRPAIEQLDLAAAGQTLFSFAARRRALIAVAAAFVFLSIGANTWMVWQYEAARDRADQMAWQYEVARDRADQMAWQYEVARDREDTLPSNAPIVQDNGVGIPATPNPTMPPLTPHRPRRTMPPLTRNATSQLNQQELTRLRADASPSPNIFSFFRNILHQ